MNKRVKKHRNIKYIPMDEDRYIHIYKHLCHETK